MTRTDIINAVIALHGFESYLEIGVRNPQDNYDRIKVEHKVGVDIAPKRGDILSMSSNDFFDEIQDSAEYDVIFIDGDHTYPQCLIDLENATQALNDGGRIIMHDLLPKSAREASPVRHRGTWCGEVHKCRQHLNDLMLMGFIVDTDHGVGVFAKAGTYSEREHPVITIQQFEEIYHG